VDLRLDDDMAAKLVGGNRASRADTASLPLGTAMP